MTRSEKVIQAILWCAAVLLGGYLGARGYMKLREDPPETCKEILRWAYGEVGEEYLSCYLPGSLYEEGENTSVAERMWERLQKEIPLYTYLKENEPVKTVVEDESTCQEIITANGQTITERLLAENQGKAVTEENENARENKEAEGEEGKEKENTEPVKEEINEETKEQVKEETQEEVPSQMPAWTSAVEVSPVKDLSMEQLSDFNYLLNNFFVVDPNTTIDSSQMDAASLLGDDLKLTGGSENPQILIYHTHSQEGYVDSVEGDENTSVIGVGNYLESILRDIFGYQVIHIKDTFDIVDGQLDRSKAYN